MQTLDYGYRANPTSAASQDTADAFQYANTWPTVLAQSNNRTAKSTLAYESYTYMAQAYDGLGHASLVARQYGPWGPNLDASVPQYTNLQGSTAQAWWLAGIKSIQNRLPGRP